jgi:uncharacterized protein involved in outer membrane biogenesis
MKKIIIRVVVVAVIVLVLLGIVAAMSLGSIVKKGVETVGPQVAKVDVKLDAASLSLLSGSGSLKGLFIGNPPGYQTPSAIKAGEVSVAVKPSSIFSDKIVVRSVKMVAPDINFEGNLQGNNLSKLLENVQGPPSTAPSTPAKKDETKRKIEVDEFSLTGAKVHVTATVLGTQTATVDLPDIHLKDLGTGPDGITVAELSERVLKAVVDGASKVAAEAMTKLGKDATEAAKNLGKGAVDDANKSLKDATDIFKKKKQ